MELIKQDHELLQFFMDNMLFNSKSTGKLGTPANMVLELIVRPECNQTCEYCYIYKHGKELYPIHERVSSEVTIKNIQALMNYLYDNHSFIKTIEIFAGDLFYDNIVFDVFDILYDYYKKIFDNYPFIDDYTVTNAEDSLTFLTRDPGFSIIMPCNFSFANNPEQVKKLKSYYEKFRAINTKLSLSWSHDGPYTNVREKVDLDDKYYDTIFNLLKDCGWGMHPMISYETIDSAIDNFKWWLDKIEQYLPERLDYMPPLLEVRNDGWTEAHIQKYIELLDYIIMDRFKRCNYDSKELARNLFVEKITKNSGIICGKPYTMDPLRLCPSFGKNNQMSCGLGHSICVNCANLSLVPCHRLAYSYYTGGHFVLDETTNTITGIQANESINAYLNQVFVNTKHKPGCVICNYKYFCIGQCNGACYEYSMEPCVPIPSVCELFQSKIKFLVKKFHELGVFHHLFTDPMIKPPHSDVLNVYIDLLVKEGYSEYEQYRN